MIADRAKAAIYSTRFQTLPLTRSIISSTALTSEYTSSTSAIMEIQLMFRRAV